MPVYEYVCAKCEHVTEALRPMADADVAMVCESCGSDRTRRMQSVVALKTTGGGRSDASAAPGPCGRCGDPRGACGM